MGPSQTGSAVARDRVVQKGGRFLGTMWMELGVVAPGRKEWDHTKLLEPVDPCPGPNLEIPGLKI